MQPCGQDTKWRVCSAVLGFSIDLLCDLESDTCPLWVSVNHSVERGLDEIILEASLSPFYAVFTVTSLTVPGTIGTFEASCLMCEPRFSRETESITCVHTHTAERVTYFKSLSHDSGSWQIQNLHVRPAAWRPKKRVTVWVQTQSSSWMIEFPPLGGMGGGQSFSIQPFNWLDKARPSYGGQPAFLEV